MSVEGGLSHLTPSQVVEAVGNVDFTVVKIRVRDLGTDGIYDAGSVTVDPNGDLLLGP